MLVGPSARARSAERGGGGPVDDDACAGERLELLFVTHRRATQLAPQHHGETEHESEHQRRQQHRHRRNIECHARTQRLSPGAKIGVERGGIEQRTFGASHRIGGRGT